MADRRLGWAACAGALLLLALALVTGHAWSATPAGVAVQNAWVRLPAAPGRPGAGYMTLVGGPAAERLVAATSPVAARVELHRAVARGGVMRMEPVVGVDLPARSRVAFAPGGLHLMLFGLKAEAAKGVPLTLRFASGRTLAVAARAQAMGADPHADH